MNMGDKDGCVLLIERDLHAATFIRADLADARNGPFHVEWVADLDVSLRRLSNGKIKVILLNLFVSDSQGIETFNNLYQIEQQILILILSDLDTRMLQSWRSMISALAIPA